MTSSSLTIQKSITHPTQRCDSLIVSGRYDLGSSNGT